MFLGIANASATAAGPAAVAAEPAVPTSAVPPQGMRKNGKQWRPVKKAFRPKAGSTSYERRKANDEAMAATKAKEKEMKEEKEAARQVRLDRDPFWANLINGIGSRHEDQGKARQQGGKRTIRENGPNDASEACRQIEEEREEEQDVEVMKNKLLGRSMAYGLNWNTLSCASHT
ncbi:hypothetical protein DSL72_006080 [Monilinia vaccinii-corymbosi]|uniref:Uncharacterized protein n=1 Tax=Monilinia vaccinii-corymbosi TaxID=61207 RepID=A0A8A3PHN8_9HELO|nr:hypothetical protein DSL72_006080 [Monilinia vaccinii-corymbosi]